MGGPMNNGKGKGRGQENQQGGNQPPDAKKIKFFADVECVICLEGQLVASVEGSGPSEGGSAQGTAEDSCFVQALCCSGIVHSKCLCKWLEASSACPICKKQLKTKKARSEFFANKICVTGSSDPSTASDIHRDFAREGEVGEDFRARQAGWAEKQRAAERATFEMLKAERKTGDEERIRLEQEEQERWLKDKKHNRSQVDPEKDAEAARLLEAEFIASEAAERKKMEEADEKYAKQLQQEDEAREAARKEQRRGEAERCDFTEILDASGDGSDDGAVTEADGPIGSHVINRTRNVDGVHGRRRRKNGSTPRCVTGRNLSASASPRTVATVSSPSRVGRSSSGQANGDRRVRKEGRGASNGTKRPHETRKSRDGESDRPRPTATRENGDGTERENRHYASPDAAAGLARTDNARGSERPRQDKDSNTGTRGRSSAGGERDARAVPPSTSPVSKARSSMSATCGHDISNGD